MASAAATRTNTRPASTSPTIRNAEVIMWPSLYGPAGRGGSVSRPVVAPGQAPTMSAVKLCYALRRGVFYPSQRDEFGTMPPREHRAAYLGLVRSIGFDGVEVGVDERSDANAARDLSSEL